MGVLLISPEINSDEEVMHMIFSWLKRECDAEICLLKDNRPYYFHYLVEGDGIPEGKQNFQLVIERVVKNVLIINVQV